MNQLDQLEPKHRNWTAVISQNEVCVEILRASRENTVTGAAIAMLEILEENLKY